MLFGVGEGPANQRANCIASLVGAFVCHGERAMQIGERFVIIDG